MAKLGVHEIRYLAKEIVRENPGGIRWNQLIKTIQEKNPETTVGTIRSCTWDLNTKFPKLIAKPSRGLFMPADGTEAISETFSKLGKDKEPVPETKLTEDDFYESFAEYLKTDLDEATESIALGGAGLRAKWGTPDVVGIYKPRASNLIKFALEIISAEIKIDPREPVTAFGQSVAYRLFSAKTYVVMPSSMTEEDKSRLEALCMLFGVGLVLFDLNVKEPNFTIRVRAQRFYPDMFYVNEFADRLKQYYPDKFDRLFS